MTRSERLEEIRDVLEWQSAKEWPTETDSGALMARVYREHIPWLLAEVERLERARRLVERQAEDDGLWFRAVHAPEAYLQVHLRELHRVIEGGQT